MATKLIHQQQQVFSNLEVHLLGRRITCMTVPAIVTAIHQACLENQKITVANYNINSFNLSLQLPWYYEFLQSAEITHCDGSGIIYALRFMGYQVPLDYRASYSLLMPDVLEHCNQQGLSLFLLGAKPPTLKMALARLQSTYPRIKLSGHHGYFSWSDPTQNQAIIDQINEMQPQVLLMGMGMPIQERWVQLYRSQLSVNAILLGGAVIDRLAGIVPDCPSVLANAGLEWLFRLLREPRRLSTRYLLGIPAFGFQVALSKYQGLVNQSLETRSAEA